MRLPSELRPGSVIDDRFLIQALVGQGGSGSVYRALDRTTNALVAIKVLHTPGKLDIERFVREAETLRGFSDQGIVRHVAHGVTDDTPYIAMEWLEGECLDERLERAPLTADEASTLGMSIARALRVAHERGVVHRDVKPSNIFLVGGSLEHGKLLDFGISIDSAFEQRLTEPGLVLGTPSYMAPEQVEPDKLVDARADVFALGCVLYRCLAGDDAFSAPDPIATLMRIMFTEPRRLAERREEIPEALDRLITRMLAKPREVRPDIATIIEVLQAIRRDEAVGTGQGLGRLMIDARRAVTVLLVRPLRKGPTRSLDLSPSVLNAVQLIAERHGAVVHRLAEHPILVLAFGATGERTEIPTDQAIRAASCAVRLLELMNDAVIGIATGDCDSGASDPLGASIERAVTLFMHDLTPRIRVDAMTAALLEIRFEIARDARGLLLTGERTHEAMRAPGGVHTRCVGREGEIATLRALFEEVAAESQPRIAFLTGDAGVGKSRVSAEFVAALHARSLGSPRVWIARGDPMRAGSPFGTLAQLLIGVFGLRDGEPTGARRAKIRVALEAFGHRGNLDSAAALLGDLAGAGLELFELNEITDVRSDPVRKGDSTRAAWLELLECVTRERALVLVLEDLHWSDQASMHFIDVALRTLRDRAILVLGVARPAADAIFPQVWRDYRPVEIQLSGLSNDSGASLVREVLGAGADDAIVEQVLACAAGNAFYIEELVRSFAEARDRGVAMAWPETVVAMAAARLQALEPREVQILRAASVFGQVFWRSGVAAVLGDTSESVQLAAALTHLAERGIVVAREGSRFAGEPEFEFAHALLREAAFAMISEADRPLAHGRAGRWLEGAGESEALVLANYAAYASEPARASVFYLRASERAFQGNDFDAAVDYAARGIALTDDDALRLALHLRQNEAHFWAGRYADARDAADIVLAATTQGDPMWLSAAYRSIVALVRLGQTARVATLGDLLERTRVLATGPEAALSSIELARGLLAAGRLEAFGRHVAETDGLTLDVMGLPAEARGRLFGVRSQYAKAIGDFEGYRELSRMAGRAFEQAGNLRNQCVAESVGSSRVDLQACKLEYSIVSPK